MLHPDGPDEASQGGVATEEAYNTAVLRLYDRERSDDARGPSSWMERQLYPIQEGRCVMDAFTDADGRMRAAEGIRADALTDDDGIGETFEAFLEFVGSPNQSSRTKGKQHVPQTPRPMDGRHPITPPTSSSESDVSPLTNLHRLQCMEKTAQSKRRPVRMFARLAEMKWGVKRRIHSSTRDGYA